MKWLVNAVILSILTVHPLVSQAQQEEVRIPLVMQCIEFPPDELLEEKYNELPFITGKGTILLPNNEEVYGVFKMFLTPTKPSTFTIMFISGTLNCMVMTGQDLEPATSGKQL